MMKMKMTKNLISLAVSATLTACAVGPDYKMPTIDAPASFQTTAAELTANPVEREFWKRFNDETLNTLINEAVKSNHDIKIALANLANAKALAREARTQLLPTILANAGYNESLDAANQTKLANATRADRESRAATVSIDMAWELDVVGRLRRATESRLANQQAVEAELNGVMTAIAAEVATNYFSLRGLQRELEATRAVVVNLQEVKKIVVARVDAGSSSALDEARITALVENARAAIPQFESAIARAINRISVLTANRHGALTKKLTEPSTLKPKASMEPVAPIIAIGSPTALIQRRPDVRAAERALAAANAQIGIAIADYYPRITIGGEVGVNAKNADDLSKNDSQFWNIGPKLVWAFLDSGRIRANVNRAEARTESALATFDKTLLTALEETDNALDGYIQSRTRESILNNAANAATDAAKLSKLRFDAGASDFLTLLDAERTRIAANRDLDQARTTTANAMVTVYKALAGGF
jgi:outer membrane protein, multidrug efflux system